MRRRSQQPTPALVVALVVILADFPYSPSTTTMAARTFNPEEPSMAALAVSNTFRRGAFPTAGSEDVVLASTDRVLFYVHSTRLLAHSSNNFGGLIVPPTPATA